jgi:hypothetical protein
LKFLFREKTDEFFKIFELQERQSTPLVEEMTVRMEVKRPEMTWLGIQPLHQIHQLSEQFLSHLLAQFANQTSLLSHV